MLDLTNKDVNELVNRYAPLLQDIKYKEDIPQMAHVLDVAIPYIQNNHNKLSSSWKAWLMLMLRKLQRQDLLKTPDDIYINIEKFVQIIDNEYDAYVTDIAIFTDEYHRDYPFMLKFLKTVGFNLKRN